MNSIALYLHIPFCQKKCYYCDFNSYSGKEYLIKDYIKALKEEIIIYKPILDNYKISTVFFGGGTPSILEGHQIAGLIDSIGDHYKLENDAEISMEANPGTLNYKKLKQYYTGGVNRLSIGLQACQNNLLQTLGRIHTFEDYLKNLEEARWAGFTNINTDLMFSLPNQKQNHWEECLERIVNLNIPHISAYSLIVEEDTPFDDWVEDKVIALPNEDIQVEMYHYTIKYLEAKGYLYYEISNFARPGFQCKHNLVYWHNKPYIGLGLGAHSYFNNKRFNNVNRIEEYITLIKNKTRPIEDEINVTVRDEISETMFLGLRLTEGISIGEFTRRFNLSPLEVYEKQINKFVEQGLLECSKTHIKLTQRGIDLSNIVFQEFLLD